MHHMKKRRKSRASVAQLERLVKFMEDNPAAVSGKLTPTFSKADKDRLWTTLVEELNEMGKEEKTLDKWKKTWKDYKCYTKKKASNINSARTGTGGGPSSKEFLTPVEERVLNLFGSLTAFGEVGVEESPIVLEEDETWIDFKSNCRERAKCVRKQALNPPDEKWQLRTMGELEERVAVLLDKTDEPSVMSPETLSQLQAEVSERLKKEPSNSTLTGTTVSLSQLNWSTITSLPGFAFIQVAETPAEKEEGTLIIPGNVQEVPMEDGSDTSEIPEAVELDATGKDTSTKAKNSSQHLEQRKQPPEDSQTTESASPDKTRDSSAEATNIPIIVSVQSGKKGQKRSLSNCVLDAHDAKKQLQDVSEENKQDLNEFDVFCESLAIQLKKMPLERALICQLKLQNVMTQERLFQLEQSM